MPKTVRHAILSFFLLNLANFLLRPIRDSIGIQIGVATLPYLFMGTLAVMVVLALVFNQAQRRRAGATGIRGYYVAFCLWLFAYGLMFGLSYRSILLDVVFFISVSVFNLFSISLLWSCLVSLFREDNAGKMFGKIASGLAAGAIGGSLFSSFLAGSIGEAGLIGIALPAILLSLGLQHQLFAHHLPAGERSNQKIRSSTIGSLWRSIRRSPLLQLSSLQIFLYAAINTFFYFEQLNIVAAISWDPADQLRLLANIALLIHVLSLSFQWFGFQFLTRKFSRQQLLLAIPLMVSVLLVAQLIIGNFWLLILGMTSLKIGSYALIRPLREVLHTQLEPAAKFGAKNLIDTVFSRSGDVIGSWTYEILFGSLAHPFLAGILIIPLSLLWIWNAWRLSVITSQ